MSGYNKILVALDFTAEADEVLDVAQRVAHQTDAGLHLLTVIKPVNYAYSGYDSMAAYSGMAAFETEAQSIAAKNLREKAHSLKIREDQVSVVLGKPSAVIKEQAKQIGADLIIVGSHCRKGLGILLGSTANAVLHGAPCDVLTVRIEP